MTIRGETRGRARALQLLYAWEVQGHPDIDLIAATSTRYGCDEPRREGVRKAAQVIQQLDRLDTDIEEAIESWRMERVGIVELNILRLGYAELLGRTVPARVVIDESVKLAQWFAGSKAPGFVNGVLDALARRSGSL